MIGSWPVWTLVPKQNLNHRSFFSVGRYVNAFIQIISFFERSSFKLSCETVIGIALTVLSPCYGHQACCLHYYLREINNDIHIYQFTMELTFTLLCPDVVMVSDFNNKIDRSTDLAKQGMVGGFAYKSDTVWGRLSVGCGRNLQRLQNSAAHIVQGRTTTEEAFEMLGENHAQVYISL